jgi:hypothetical protein
VHLRRICFNWIRHPFTAVGESTYGGFEHRNLILHLPRSSQFIFTISTISFQRLRITSPKFLKQLV